MAIGGGGGGGGVAAAADRTDTGGGDDRFFSSFCSLVIFCARRPRKNAGYVPVTVDGGSWGGGTGRTSARRGGDNDG